MVWFADIDQAKPTQELDDVGSVIGSKKTSFETLCSPIAQGLMKTMCPESTSSGVRRNARKHLPMFTRPQIAFMIYASFKINDVKGRAMNTNDFAQYQIGQRHSQEVRPVYGQKP